MSSFETAAVLLGIAAACVTYAVVVFSILVQGLTMRRLLVHYHVGVAER